MYPFFLDHHQSSSNIISTMDAIEEKIPPQGTNLAEDSCGSSLEEAQQTGITLGGYETELFHADEEYADDFEDDAAEPNVFNSNKPLPPISTSTTATTPTPAENTQITEEQRRIADDHKRQIASAQLIQQRARMRIAKKKVEERRRIVALRVQQRQEISAATNIQRMQRARKAKQKVEHVRHVKHTTAATKMQSSFRRREATKKVQKVRHVKQTGAATKMQASFRRREATKQVQHKREERIKETNSAIKLQSVTRGGLERRRRAKQKAAEKEATIKIQSVLRGRKDRQRVAEIHLQKEIRAMKKDRKKRKQWAGLNKQRYSPYREALSLASKRDLRYSREYDDVEGTHEGLLGNGNSQVDSYLLGGSSLIQSSSVLQTPLIDTENSIVEAEARAEIEAILVRFKKKKSLVELFLVVF